MIKPRNLDFGSRKNEIVHTASECINDNLINTWSYSWTKVTNTETNEVKKKFSFEDESINAIRKWVDQAFEEKKLGWLNVFADSVTALDFKNTFFSHVSDIELFALYFDEEETNRIIDEFKPASDEYEEIGLYQILSGKILESDVSNEKFIGFDLIGMDDGGDFHTFHCHDIGAELSQRFDLTLNGYGLFGPSGNWKPVLDFLNDEKSGCEPVPWFVAKTKLVEM